MSLCPYMCSFYKCHLVKPFCLRFEGKLEDADLSLASANSGNLVYRKTTYESRIEFCSLSPVCSKIELHVPRTVSLQSSVYPRQTQQQVLRAWNENSSKCKQLTAKNLREPITVVVVFLCYLFNNHANKNLRIG